MVSFSPSARLYSRASFGLKILPYRNRHREATGIYFELNNNGSETILWKKKLLIYPQDVMIHHPYVITLDTLYSSQQVHAIVVYGPEGQVITDLALGDFLSKDEIKEYGDDPDCFHQLFWREYAHISIQQNLSTELHLHFTWGKVLGISLETGYLIQYWPPKPLFSPEWSSNQFVITEGWLPKDSGKYGIYSEKRFKIDHTQ